MSSPRRQSASSAAAPEAVVERGKPIIAVLFLLSLLIPHAVWLGPIQLKGYRLLLMVLFVPLFIQLMSGKAGKMTAIDWLMLGSSLWAVLALAMNHPFGQIIEPAGVHMIEFFGAYLAARVAIRSADDFLLMVKVMSLIVLCLLPFVIIEAVTRQPVLLQLVGKANMAVYADIRFGLRRAQAVFSHPIHLGVFVSATFGLFWYARRPDAPLFGRIKGATMSGLGTFFSLSTGALMAFMVQFIFIAWEFVTKSNPKRWKIFTWGAIVGYIVVDLLATKSPFHVLVHRLTFNPHSAYNRILIWQFGTDNVVENPIFGLGMRDWERPSYMSASLDNYWLFIAVFYGLPSIAMCAGALYLIIRRLARAELTMPAERACRAAYLTTIGGLILAGGTVHYWHAMMAYVMFLFGTGVWMTQQRDPDVEVTTTEKDPSNSRPTRPGPLLGGRQPARSGKSIEIQSNKKQNKRTII